MMLEETRQGRRQVGLIHGIDEIKNKLSKLLHLQHFETICKYYKELCRKLCYYLSRIEATRSKFNQLHSVLHRCIQLLHLLVRSYQHQKYGHLLPIMGFTVRKYQRCFDCKVELISPAVLMERIDRNQSSGYFKMCQRREITKQQRIFLRSSHIHPFFSNLLNNESILQNSQCLCCSQVFIKNFPIFNENPLISVMLEFSEKKGHDRNILERCLNAVLNSGGGVLVVGADKQGYQIKAVGIIFRSEAEIIKKEFQIREAILKIQPPCKFSIERVLVHTNYIDNAHIEQEQMRFCLRIFILPSDQNRLSYLEHVIKGRETVYETYKMDNGQKYVKVQYQLNPETNQPENIYTLIHRKYKKKKPLTNSHRNILCLRPYQNYSKIFHTYMEQGGHSYEYESDFETSTNENQAATQGYISSAYPDQPKFLYQMASLLVITSKKNNRWVEDFQEELKQKKKLVERSRPFFNSFPETGRLIWLMTHEISCQQLKNILKSLQNQSKIKLGAIKLMPVSKNLQVQCKFLKKFHLTALHEKFTQRYKEEYRIQDESVSNNTETIDYTFFSFNDYGQSIFAYMVLEGFSLKPYFVKDGNSYKKKDKIGCF